MVKRKLTGAHYGLRDWAMQRATAVVMVLFLLFAWHDWRKRLHRMASLIQ